MTMKIKRIINGEEYIFKLLTSELEKAFDEYQRKADIDNVKTILKKMKNEKGSENAGSLLADPDRLSEIAEWARGNIDSDEEITLRIENSYDTAIEAALKDQKP